MAPPSPRRRARVPSRLMIQNGTGMITRVFRGRRHPGVTGSRLLEKLPSDETLGDDDRGNRRARLALGEATLTESEGGRHHRVGGANMVVYTYDIEANALYVLLAEDSGASIDRTEELGPTLLVVPMIPKDKYIRVI